MDDGFRRFIRIEANGFEKNREVLKVISIGNRVKQSGKWKRKVITLDRKDRICCRI